VSRRGGGGSGDRGNEIRFADERLKMLELERDRVVA
jgi:hypothetical protein